MRHWLLQSGLVTLILLGAVATVAAGGPPAVAVPEISPTSLSAALAIVAGGALVIRARRGK